MPQAPHAASSRTGDDPRLAPLFAAIVLVEVVTIAALYAFGRYFS